MHQETLTYFSGDSRHKGYVAFEGEKGLSRPGILIAPAWKGIDGFARQKADELASMGYVALVADMYGEGKCAQSNAEAAALMQPLFLDRQLLQERIQSAYQALKLHDLVDPRKIGAIGFCFGGITVIELLRSGVDIKGVVSFHAVIANTYDGKKVKQAPMMSRIRGSLLMLHGYLDPLVNTEAFEELQKELAAAQADWQLHIYGEAMHAFTNPLANDPNAGLLFNPKANLRAIRSMENFFEEIFI